MKKLLTFLPLGVMLSFCMVGAADAANNSNLNVKILPLECQFNIIDTGTNEIEYLTPAECGQIQDPDDPPVVPGINPLPINNGSNDTVPGIKLLPPGSVSMVQLKREPQDAATSQTGGIGDEPDLENVITPVAKIVELTGMSISQATASFFVASSTAVVGIMGASIDFALFQGRGLRYLYSQATRLLAGIRRG